MGTRWKVVGKAEKRPKPKHLLGVYDVPDEALRLAEDIQTLELILILLDRLNERSFIATDAKDYNGEKLEAAKALRRIAYLIGTMKRICEKNLCYDFLAGERIKPRERRQTIADVYQLLLDGMRQQ